MGDGRLQDEHGLRPAEAAERGERRKIRPAACGRGSHVGNEVAVGRVEQRPLQDGGGEVRAGARVLVEGHFVGQDLAVLGQPDLVVRRIGMALAGPAHVLVAAQGQLDGTAQPERGQRGQRGPGRGLVLLAAEGAAQARHVDLHLVHGQPQDAGDGALDHGRGLGRGIDFQAAVDRAGRPAPTASRDRYAPGRRNRPGRRPRRGRAARPDPRRPGRRCGERR